jgi:tetratricopeptide (TPR) repeat protein
MQASAPYRASFAVGVGTFLLSCALGLGWSLVSQQRLPAIEGEGALARSIDEHRAFALIQPRNPYAYVLLGQALLEAGDSDGAVLVLEESLGLNPVPGEVHATLAGAYYRRGRFDEARQQARRAVGKGVAPDDALLRQLGLARRDR